MSSQLLLLLLTVTDNTSSPTPTAATHGGGGPGGFPETGLRVPGGRVGWEGELRKMWVDRMCREGVLIGCMDRM